MYALRSLSMGLIALIACTVASAAALGVWHFKTAHGQLVVTRIPTFAQSAPVVQPDGVTLRAKSRPLPRFPSQSATDSWQIAYRTTVSRTTNAAEILAPMANEEVAAQVASRMRILQYGRTEACGKSAGFYTVSAYASQFSSPVYSVRVIAVFDTQVWESTLNMIDRPEFHRPGALQNLLKTAGSFCVKPS